MTSGLGCDGETLAMTSATSPSLEDLIGQSIPGAPRVVIHNPVLALENGEDFLRAWYDAEEGRLDPFILVVEGAIANEQINGDGHWSGFGTNPLTDQPITTNEWVDRLAPRAAAVVAVGTCATYGGIPAMRNNPTGAMGLPDYLGWSWRSRSGLPIVCIPGCPAQPDNMTEMLLLLALYVVGLAPAPKLDEQLRPEWLFGRTTRDGCNRAGFTNRATSRPYTATIHAASSSSGAKARSRDAMSRPAAGSTASVAVRTSAGSVSPARCLRSPTSTCRSWSPTTGATRRRTSSASAMARCSATSAVPEALRARARVASPPGRAHDRVHAWPLSVKSSAG
jgi:hypothetical protein